MKIASALGLLAALCLLPVAARGAPSDVTVQAQITLAILGADVLPMNGEGKLVDQTVVISGVDIAAVGAEASVPIPPRARVIDAHGLTLMPGLVDMHVHLPSDSGEMGGETQRMLAVMLASGVTTVRGMQGFRGNLVARQAVEEGLIPGPRIYAASLPIKDDNTATVEAARATVRDAKRRGFDLIKSHNINSVDVWNAVEDEARKNGLPTAGHVTSIVGLDRALAAGEEVEHLDGALHDLLPMNAPERRIMFAQIPPPKVMRALTKTTDRQIRALAAKVAATGSFQVPTLAAFAAVANFDQPTAELAAAPEMRFVPPATLKAWADDREEMRREGFMRGEARSFVDLRNRIVRAYAAAGVPLMAGSDTPQNFRIPGSGLIQEIEALNAAGLSRMAALRAATVTPRDYFRTLSNGGSALGWKADFGTIEPGARADLILVSGDPSTDLSALHRVQAVIAGGRFYDRAALDALLDAAASAATHNQPQASASPYEPIIEKVAAALDRYRVVGIGDDSHRDKEAHDLQVALISDPRILCKIDAIAVEFGNGALQDIADRYVSGETVPETEKRRIWRDTGQWLVWDSPLYEDFFDQVRALNARKICPKPVRVLLADPPIDWSKVHSAAEYKAYRIRDEYFASVVEREILDKGKRGLIIAGDSHLWKALPAGTAEKPLMGMLVEAYAPGALASFTFPPNSDETAKAGLPSAPSLTLLAGTQWGKRDFGKLVPDDETVMMHVGRKVVGKRLDSIRWPPAERVVDGLLNLGPFTVIDPDPAIYWNDPAYLAELRRRAPILKAFYGLEFRAQLDKIMNIKARSRKH